jgi:hypothetical protein
MSGAARCVLRKLPEVAWALAVNTPHLKFYCIAAAAAAAAAAHCHCHSLLCLAAITSWL